MMGSARTCASLEITAAALPVAAMDRFTSLLRSFCRPAPAVLILPATSAAFLGLTLRRERRGRRGLVEEEEEEERRRRRRRGGEEEREAWERLERGREGRESRKDWGIGESVRSAQHGGMAGLEDD